MIDWTNPKSKISKYFTVGEATYLPQLKMYYSPTDVEKQNIIKLAETLDKVREIVNKPFIVNIWIRPVVTKLDGTVVDYNALIGGAKNSAHKAGNAVDLRVREMEAEDVRKLLAPSLESLGLRMEADVSWCHFDNRPVPSGGNRIFKP